jgi:DNA-binding MarR family transcriptional regulator
VPPTRAKAIEEIAQTLLPRASRLTRLLLRPGSRALSRTEAGVLGTLASGPRRITELAESEALAQPTVTQLVDRMQKRGLVARERSTEDGRVVLVSIAPMGHELLEHTRAQYRALLRDAVRELPDDEVQALATATATLQRLIDSLQRGGAA